MAKRFKTMDDVRRYLGKLINRVEAGEVDASLAGKIGYLTSIILKAIEHCDLEARVKKLEEAAKEKEVNQNIKGYV